MNEELSFTGAVPPVGIYDYDSTKLEQQWSCFVKCIRQASIHSVSACGIELRIRAVNNLENWQTINPELEFNVKIRRY
ncbi:hypothetical protein NNL21_07490 [Paenibacillus mendelii]|nr:hypothetical protein [Paenibacillus mendelii]